MSLPNAITPAPAVPLRPPETVMRLDRLGAMHPTRLSFARAMLRRVEHERWRVTRALWSLDADGFGHAVYRVETPSRTYSLVAFSQDLAPEARTDRVIAEAWDATFVLYDGMPDRAEIARLEAEVPLQEAGRFAETELVLSRANKSVRLFERVVSALAAGRQPDIAELDEVGYLMRTTAVYGNGKFGIADRDVLAGRPEFAGPFRAEMLTVWLIRGFTVDLAEHCAAARGPQAVRLAPSVRLRLGVGNSTGLGMAPFLVRHPMLLNNWMTARETALARVRSLPTVDDRAWASFAALLRDAIDDVAAWRTGDGIQASRIEDLRKDLVRLAAETDALPTGERSWDGLFRWCESHLGNEAQDYVIGLMIEPHGDLVDDLADRMSADEPLAAAIDGTMDCAALSRAIERTYAWALDADYADPDAQARFWYVSAEKLEPRLGERWAEDGAEREQPLAIARDVAALRSMLREVPGPTLVARFLLDHPDQRHVVRRVQVAARFPYAEIRGNLIDAALRPTDLLRCKLAFFGASRFDPRSDRWLRIALFRGAPFPDEAAWCDAGGPAGVLKRGTVSPSLNEVEGLAAKAARGAGAGWGTAEDTARAIRWMAKHDLDWATPLLRLLGSGGAATALAPVFEAGDRLGGVGDGDAFALEGTSPVWILAVLSCAVYGRDLGVDVAASDRLVRLQPDGGVSSREPLNIDALGPDRVLVTARRAGALPHVIGPIARRRAIPASVWDALEDYAVQTYVQPTLRSRLMGAGGDRVDAD